jgi:protein TonB
MAFEALLDKPDQKPRRWRRAMISISLALHGIALAVGVVYSVWAVAEMPLPAIQVTLAEAPPPPPPPPPPAGGQKSQTKPKTRVTKPQELVQPKDTPKDEPKEQDEPAGQPGGVEGGVEGGVVGGVVGGIVGTAPPPPPKDTGPKVVSAGVGTRQLLVNPGVPPYCCPKIPKALAQSDTFTSRLRVCVTAQGQVYDVRVVQGAGPAIDSQIPAYVRRWRYKPMIVDGEARPFCYPVTYEISQR